MIKKLLFFSLLIFSFSFCEAQDTIAFKTGEKDAVKVIFCGKKTINFILEDTAYSVNESRVNYIKYNGLRYSFKQLSVKFDSINRLSNIEMDKEDSANFRPLYINIGAGFSSIEANIISNDNIPNGELGPYFLSQSPAYNFIIDYSFIRWLSVGIGAVYQSVTDNPSEELPSNNIYATNANEVEKITRYNYSGRILYHPLKHSILDVYLGVRAGESSWKEQITSNSQAANAIIYTTDISSSQISYQVLAGAALPLYHCIGIHLELGLGNPYVFEAGITFML